MAQKNLNKLYPKIDGGKQNDFGFGKIAFIKTDTEPTATEGVIYFDDDENKFKMCTDGSTWTAISAANVATTGLDGAYDLNNTIAVDGSALTLTATSTTNDTFQINSAAVTGDDKALVDLVWTGTPHAGANLLRLDGSGMTTTNTPYLMEIAANAKDVGAIYIDTDAATDSQVVIHNDGIIGAGNAALLIDNDGDINATGNLLFLDATGSTGTNTAYTAKIDSHGIDMAALYIDADAATDSAVYIVGGGAIANNKALLEIVADGTPAHTGSNLLRIDGSGMTATNTPTLVEIDGHGKDVGGLFIDADCATKNVALFNGGGNLGDGSAVVAITADGATQTAGGCLLTLTNSGTVDTDSRYIEIVGNGVDMRAIYCDTDSATNDGVYILNQGNIASGKAAVHIDIDGTPNAAGFALLVEGTGATMSGTPYLVKFDTSTKDAGALTIDSDAVTDDCVVINSGGALADNKAVLLLKSDGTMAAGVANYLRIDATGAATTNVPTAIEIVGAGETMQGIYSDVDLTNKHANHFHCGGALTNGLGVVGITNDGNLAAGGNLLNVTLGGTPADSTVCAVEIVAAADCQALAIATSAATQSGVLITGSGATANNTAVFEVNWGTSVPANAGSNLVRLDASGATNTVKPVILEIYDDSVSVGLVVQTASVEDMVSFIGAGATGAAKSVVDITSTGVMNATGNLLRLDLTGADTTAAPTALEIVGAGETARGIYVDTDGTSVGAAAFHSGGALTNGIGVVMITNDGNLATGGNLLNVTVGGTPHTAAAAVEIVSAKDCYALDVTTSAATNSAVQITGVGAVANDKALLHVIHATGAIVAGGSIVRIEGNANAGGATAYGMTINCNATNLEGLWVEAGTVLIAETLTVTGVTTCTGGVVSSIGTAADLHNTAPIIGDLTTAFGAAYATKAGWIGTVRDTSTSQVYLVSSNGTTFTYTLMTTSLA